jgi:hypothetical protein
VFIRALNCGREGIVPFLEEDQLVTDRLTMACHIQFIVSEVVGVGVFCV